MIDKEIKIKKVKTESSSKRLRSVIFLVWKEASTNEGFETYYERHINAIIAQYKSKIKDTP